MSPKRKKDNLLLRIQPGDGDHRVEIPSSANTYSNQIMNDNMNIEEWIHCFLGDIPLHQSENRKSKKLNILRIHNQRKAIYRRFRSPTPYQWKEPREKASVGEIRYFNESSAPVNNDQPLDYSCNSYKSKESRPRLKCRVKHTKKCSKEYTLLQRINRYIKAGIVEGKKQAKRYVQKALAFALQMGYLVPADKKGRLLRLSPFLAARVQRKSIRGRMTKRNARGKYTIRKRDRRKSDLTCVIKKTKDCEIHANRKNNSKKRRNSRSRKGFVIGNDIDEDGNTSIEQHQGERASSAFMTNDQLINANGPK